MKALQEVLSSREGNYLSPFFWQHGESEDVLRTYVNKIYESGMRAFCIEARPHPQFAQEQWWNDLSIIFDEAEKLGMKVWILDDSHFPTGYANGLAEKKYPQLMKVYLDHRRYDVVGPLKNGRLILRYLKGKPWEQAKHRDDRLLAVFAAKRELESSSDTVSIDPDSIIEITDRVRDGILYWDIPDGAYSVIALFETREGGEEGTKNYLNPLLREGTEVLLEAVYEPHYQHFSDRFGKTVTAFFSDEPRFGNAKGCFAVIGRCDMVLPWKTGLETELPFARTLLPLLFVDADGAESQVRCQYMDTVSRLYSENFTQVLGQWCRDHGVGYVGHNIEDNGAHARLGYGPGHIFRAQMGQSCSGIDVISTQIVPGYDFHHDAFTTGGNNGEFYHYALAKLGSSIAQADEKKAGRAMCEAFGAYGWSEGLKLMKWITDHLLVRGINYFVPHAFNPKEYPDWDCAPHFYAHGHNPQFRYFPILTAYMNRLCHLFQNGTHVTSIAVLYPAEAEWSGKCLPLEKVLKVLTKNQLDCNVVPVDALTRSGSLRDGEFAVCKNRYACLVVPYAEKLPGKLIETLLRYRAAGVNVIFAGGFPTGGSMEISRLKESVTVVPLDGLPDVLDQYRDLKAMDAAPDLVSYHYKHDGGDIYMLFNEHPHLPCKTNVWLNCQGIPAVYDAFANQLTGTGYVCRDGGILLPVCLEAYQSCVICIQTSWPDGMIQPRREYRRERTEILQAVWDVSVANALEYPDFRPVTRMEQLEPLSIRDEFLDYTGTARYEAEFDLKNVGDMLVLDLGELYEVVSVWVNGQLAGEKICPPYRFDIGQMVHPGKNRLRIEITNTLGNENKEFMTQYLPVEPFGLVGPVRLIHREA